MTRSRSTITMSSALLVVFIFIAPVHGDELAERIRQLRENGSPTSIAELKPRAVKDKSNGAAILNQAWPALTEFERSIFEYSENVLMAPVDRKMIGLHDALVKKHAKLFKQIELAAQAPVYQAALPYDNSAPMEFTKQVMDQTSRFRSVCRVLMFRARVLAAKGEGKAAANAALQMLALSRKADNQPFLVSRAVSAACHRMSIMTLGYVLQTATIPEAVRKEIDGSLQEYETLSLQKTIESERALGLTQGKRYSVRFQLDYLNYCEMQIANADKTFPQYEQQLEKMDKDVLQRMLQHPLVSLLDPSFKLVRRSNTNNLGLARCVRILNRLQANKIDKDKVDLSSLRFAKPVTMDPFNDQSIQVERFKTGWRISFSGGMIRPRDDEAATKKE